MEKMVKLLAYFFIFSMTMDVFSGNAKYPDDNHYTDSGFFDIHVCNWPDRAPFYMILYSTIRFNDIKSVEIMNASGEKLAALDLSKFKILTTKKKTEKRVFINQIGLPDDYKDGWFSAKIMLNNGDVHMAKDFVKHGIMPMASGQSPANRDEISDVPKALRWSAVKGAGYYRVFIKDKWDEDKLILSSALLKEPKLMLPVSLLERGGYYSWRIHARDVNEDIKLGDFNQGSLNREQEFTIAY